MRRYLQFLQLFDLLRYQVFPFRLVNHLPVLGRAKPQEWIVVRLHNPAARIESLPLETSEMHMPFSNEQQLRIKETLISKGNQQLLLFIKFLYYLFLRPGFELRLLRVRDIKQHTVFVPAADRAKNNKGEHVVIPAALEEIIGEFRLRRYNKEYFVFSALGVPGPELAGINYFYKRHRKLLDELALTDEQYTLYGYKHTGAINLYEATKDLLAVQRHCRHSSSSQIDAYLRKYGVIVDTQVLNMPRFGAPGKIKSA
jgi:hypothetical protein